MSQIPRGPEGMKCPDWKKPMSKVCHTCPLWMKIPVTDPKTNAEIDDWKCGKVWAVLLQFHACKEAATVSTELNELRNETKQSHDHNLAMGAIAINRAAEATRSVLKEIIAERDATTIQAPSSTPLLASS